MPRADREPLPQQLERILRRAPRSMPQLVELTGRHRETIRAALHAMRDKGLVRLEQARVPARGQINMWAIND